MHAYSQQSYTASRKNADAYGGHVEAACIRNDHAELQDPTATVPKKCSDCKQMHHAARRAARAAPGPYPDRTYMCTGHAIANGPRRRTGSCIIATIVNRSRKLIIRAADHSKLQMMVCTNRIAIISSILAVFKLPKTSLSKFRVDQATASEITQKRSIAIATWMLAGWLEGYESGLRATCTRIDCLLPPQR